MRRLLWLGLVVLALLVPARADPPFDDMRSADQWTTYYYVQKDVAAVPGYLQWLGRSGVLEKSGTEQTVAAFIATIFIENPDRVRGWVSGPSFDERTMAVIKRALWLAGRNELIAATFHQTPDYARTKAVALLDWPLRSPTDFDMMWAAFMASGNPAYPARLLDLVDGNVAFTGNKTIDTAYRAAIDWSLLTSMRQHELILRMVTKEAGRHSGPVQKNLEDKLATLQSERHPMENCDGEFCAMLALISEDNLKEFAKPADQGPILKFLDKAKVGDNIAVKICFADMALTDDLSADVSFDIKVLKPDGSIYEGSALNNVEALKAKTPTRRMIFDNNKTLMVRFEPQDPRGTYTVAVVVKDNIGGKKLALSRKIALSD